MMIEVTIIDFIETSPFRLWILASRKTVRNKPSLWNIQCVFILQINKSRPIYTLTMTNMSTVTELGPNFQPKLFNFQYCLLRPWYVLSEEKKKHRQVL